MQATEVGELTVAPQGDLLRLTIAEQQPTTTLTRQDALAAIDYLQAWVVEQDAQDGPQGQAARPTRARTVIAWLLLALATLGVVAIAMLTGLGGGDAPLSPPRPTIQDKLYDQWHQQQRREHPLLPPG